MPDMSLSGVLDGTTLNCLLSLSFSNRTSNSVTVHYTAVTYLNPSGYTQAGYEEYTGRIHISGNGITPKTQSIVLKQKSEAWQGNTRHTTTGSFSLKLTGLSEISTSALYTVNSSADSSNSIKGSMAIVIPAYIPLVPDKPQSITVDNEIYNGKSFAVLCSESSLATGYIIYYSVNGGDWIALQNKADNRFNVILTDIYPNDLLLFKACAYNDSGESEPIISNETRCCGGLYIKTQEGYKRGCPIIKIDNTWVTAKCVYIKNNGVWEAGK